MATSNRRGEMRTANMVEAQGVGKVVENVEWGPKGTALTVVRAIGWVVRTFFIVAGGLCVFVEVKQWQELGYPFPLQCFMFLVTAIGVGVTLWLIVTNPCEVEKDDVMKVSPRLGVTWTWCSHCRLFCPPGSMHCFLCHRCIEGIHHHCVALWRCIGKRTLPAFITALGTFTVVMLINFIMITEPTASFRTIGWNYVIFFPVTILLGSSIWSLMEEEKWNSPQVYPSSVFVVRAAQEVSDAVPFTFSFSGNPVQREEHVRMVFRPTGAWKILPESRKVKELPLCPKRECRAVANPFWKIGGTDAMLNCNICGADFAPPRNVKRSLLDHLFAETDVQCLLGNDKPRSRPWLVFVLDVGLHDVRTCIHSWVLGMPNVPNVEIFCYETRTCTRYSDGTMREEKLGYVSLDALVNRSWKKVASRGGRVVFLSGQDTGNLKGDLVEALINAASNITLNVVCVGSSGVDRNPLIQPLMLHHQARTKGWTRLVESSRDAIKLVKSGIFLFWGVMGHGRIQWTPGVKVAKIYKRGAAHSGQSSGSSFSLMCLDREDEVEFSLKVDPDTVLHRRRVPDREDNTVYFQLHMLYTNLKGMKVLAVFNRMFSVDDMPGCP